MPAGSYYVKAEVKLLLEIATGTTSFDTLLDQHGADGNRYVDDLLYIYAGTLPLTGDQLDSATNIANYHACMMFKVQKNAPSEVVNNWKTLRDDAVKVLIGKLQAQPNTNTQSLVVVIESEYKSSELEGL